MPNPPFKAFRSTVTPFQERRITSSDRVLVDPVTGAPVGFENPNANGAHARFTPVDITTAQLATPSDEMLADLDATYRLNVAPYPRYQSNGVMLLSISNGADIVVPAGVGQMLYSPLTISAPSRLIVQGVIHVTDFPA